MIAWCLSRPSPSYQPRYANVAPALGMRPGSMQCTQTRRAWTTTSACKTPFGLGLVRAIGVAPRTAPTTLPPPRATPRRFAAAKLVAARPLPSGTQSGVARMSMPLPPRGWTSPPSRRTRRCGTTSVVPRVPSWGCSRPIARPRHRVRHHSQRRLLRHRLPRRRRFPLLRPISPLRHHLWLRCPHCLPRRQTRPRPHQHRRTASVREPLPGSLLESSCLSALALQLSSGALPTAAASAPIHKPVWRQLNSRLCLCRAWQDGGECAQARQAYPSRTSLRLVEGTGLPAITPEILRGLAILRGWSRDCTLHIRLSLYEVYSGGCVGIHL